MVVEQVWDRKVTCSLPELAGLNLIGTSGKGVLAPRSLTPLCYQQVLQPKQLYTLFAPLTLSYCTSSTLYIQDLLKYQQLNYLKLLHRLHQKQ